MLSSDLFEVQRFLRERGILISFSGRLSQELIEEYGEAVKKYLETDDAPRNEVYNIFSIFVEQTQNIKNYCGSKADTPNYDEISQSCIITIGKSDQKNYIVFGNLIENRDIPALTDKIDALIALSKEDLKKVYKQKLKQELPPDSTGAGIGLIEIARKSTEPLEYAVQPKNDQLSFFTLKAVV